DQARPAMVPIHNAAWARTPVQAHAMARLCGRPLRRPLKESSRSVGDEGARESTHHIDRRSCAAGPRLHSPLRHSLNLCRSSGSDDQRVITEVVVNGHLIENADEAPANELRPVPNWLGDALDRASQRAY